MMTNPIEHRHKPLEIGPHTRNNSWRIRIAPQNNRTNFSLTTNNGTKINVTGKLHLNEDKNGIDKSHPSTVDSSIKIHPISTETQHFTVYLPTTTIHGVTSIIIVA